MAQMNTRLTYGWDETVFLTIDLVFVHCISHQRSDSVDGLLPDPLKQLKQRVDNQ